MEACMNRTRQLCDFLAALSIEQIGEKNLLDIHYKLLDWIGCCIAANGRPVQKRLAALALQEGGTGATGIGIPEAVSPWNAAFYNGCISHALEYDDTNKIAITHPGAPVLAAALAACEAEHADFELLALGITAGYEAMIRLGGAVNPDHYEYFHTTGTCGAFAAAAAASRIMGLDSETLERAFGIVSTMASGLVCVFGTEAKLVTVGNAARNGLMAAQMARAGLSAPEDAFASDKGFARACRGKEDLSFMVPKPGDALLLEDAYYKMHASCGHTHSALDALQALLKETPVCPEDVERIEVEVYKTAQTLCAAYQTETETKAKFSLPYCVACMLHFGQVTLSQFTPELLASASLSRYAQRISIRENPDFTRVYPQLRPEKVTLFLKDGRILSRQVDLPVGRPEYSFIETKFDSLAGMGTSPEQVHEIRALALGLSLQDRPSSLMQALKSL